MEKLTSDYFCFSIPQSVQSDAALLLGMAGVLNSVSGRFKLFIKSIYIEPGDLPMFENIQQVEMVAKVLVDNADSLVEFAAIGSLSQCYNYLVVQFSSFLSEYEDSIYLITHKIPVLEDLMQSQTTKSNENIKVDLSALQHQVDKWIKSVGVDYFNELTNMSNLVEEVGEVARLIGREFGQQSFKPNERPVDVKGAIADELADVLFVLTCLANQMDINLSEAFIRNMEKKTNRDANRHKSNPALNAKGD
ncbi:nucleotide pyrophosphohydrolase [Alteromonas facilis]|uniref:nucleotide pyrophosphohydrolase n=1 Tax=Alteromonas facilis TaxID=2048004 RepID=UPI00196BA3F0|nr:nucleotide pyrophosphohydrolase [Alteromonas facilis]